MCCCIDPADVTSNTYINSKEINDKDPKLTIFLEYQNIKNIFAKGYVPNWSDKVFVIAKVKNTAPWKNVISDLNRKKLLKCSAKNNRKKPNQKQFKVEKVIKRKHTNLYVKWKGYNNLFNSRIDKKDSINQ